ncbi:MAG: PAS domain-containing protein [Gammaproteobacteria bacterium]|nr:PAS domain-containing protein [Gammaproteobacteria bacterium]
MEAAPVAMMVYRERRILFANGMLASLLKYPSFDSLRDAGASLDRHFTPEALEILTDSGDFRTSGTGVFAWREVRGRDANGTVLSLFVRPVDCTWEGEDAVLCHVLSLRATELPMELLAAVGRIAVKLPELSDFDDAVELMLEEICRAYGWPLGEVWLSNEVNTELVRGPSWHGGTEPLEKFAKRSESVTFGPNQGLGGRVWANGTLEWIGDVSAAPERLFKRAPWAREAGLAAACGLPVIAHRRVLAVLVFFLSEFSEPDRARIKALEQLTRPFASFLLRAKEQRMLEYYGRILGSTPDFVAYVDRNYRYLAISGAYQTEFKKSPEDLLGKSVAELYGEKTFRNVVKPRMDVCLAGKPQQVRAWIDFPSRGRRWLDISYTPQRDASGNVTGIVLAGRDLTELRRSQERLTESRQQLRALTARLNHTREQERRDVAVEIHDEIGQRLTALKIELGELQKISTEKTPDAEQGFDRVTAIVDSLFGEIRGLSARLRPPLLDQLGLEDAVRSMLDRLSRGTRWTVKLEVESSVVRAMDDAAATTIYRIVQEALTNVARHAGARTVNVRIFSRRRWVVAEIADDGRGFDHKAARASTSIGMIGMRERAAAAGGRLVIISGPARGTVVRLWLPLAPTG